MVGLRIVDGKENGHKREEKDIVGGIDDGDDSRLTTNSRVTLSRRFFVRSWHQPGPIGYNHRMISPWLYHVKKSTNPAARVRWTPWLLVIRNNK